MSRPTPRTTSKNRFHRSLGTGLAAFAACGLFATTPASAHFELQKPASWMSQDALGAPEKAPPCGDEGGGTVTGTITALHPGETVTVTINEIIYHPGHYRIALATDRTLLPPEPIVTAGATACGSVPVETAPTFPVLADGVFEHSAPFSGPQTIQVTLPTNITCTKCTLQVIEFMSDHPLNNPGGCFYHHCADLSIQPGADPDGGAGAGQTDDAGDPATGGDAGDPATGGDAGSGSGGAGSADASTPSFGNQGATPASSGCSFAVPTNNTPAFTGLAGLFALALLRVGRRRSKSAGR